MGFFTDCIRHTISHMIDLIAKHHEELQSLCREFCVRSLDLIGSATDNDFDPQHSDLDFLVEFHDHPTMNAFHQFFRFQMALRQLFDKKIDLTDASAMKNPVFIQTVNAQRTPLYAA